jgi:excisionase family DNA binding protein
MSVIDKTCLLTIREVASVLGVSEVTVRRKVANGELPAVRLGGKHSAVRVDPEDLEAWLYADTEGAA